MIAVCSIREQPHYRREAFVSGLQRAGYTIVNGGKPSGPQDLLVQWNRYGTYEAAADRWEACGGTVIVCENGYLGRDEQDRQYYAMSIHGHNGSGWFPVGDEDRFAKLNIPIEPWQDNPNGHIVIRGQRGIGTAQMASPPNWHRLMAKKLGPMTGREIRVIEHPGRHDPPVPVDEYLRGSWACCIWSSAVGVRALTMGIPVLYSAPHWICEVGARRLNDLSAVIMDDAWRARALHKMAYGQRSVAEIETGEPFVTIRESVRKAA